MSAGAAFTPTPHRISNRGLIKQMELHGWRMKKVSGEFTTMVSPVGDKIEVRSGHNHTGNSKDVINEVLRLTGITWEEFMYLPRERDEIIGQVLRSVDHVAAPEDAVRVYAAIDTVDALERTRRKEVKRKRAEEERDRQRRQKEERKARPTPPVKDEPVEPVADQRQRGIADAVFGVILQHSGPITNQQITEALGDDYDKVKVGSAANYLHNALGVIERVKRGVWQRKHEYSPHDMTFDVVSRNLERIPEESRPTMTVTPIRPPEALPPAVRDGIITRDGDLNEMLDLLFPDGFKAKHLPIIEAWKVATQALMDAVEEGR